MTVFNRIVAIVAAVVVLATAAIILLVTAGAVSSGFLPSDWFDVPLARAADASGVTMAAIIAGSALVIVLALAVLVLEFALAGRRRLLLISSSEEGSASIDEGSVRLLAEKAASAVNSVRAARCFVREKPNGLAISCRALTGMGSNIPELSAELQGQIKETVSQFTGLPVSDVSVKVKYERANGKRVMVS